MYVATDPRSTLQPSVSAARPVVTAFAGAEYARFYATPPTELVEGARTWIARGQNFALAYSDVESGAHFRRQGQSDEYMVLLPNEGIELSVTADGESVPVQGPALVIVPPGDSEIRVEAPGRMVRLFTTASGALEGKALNEASYAQPHPNIPPFVPWPEPVGGYRIRVYSLNVPAQEGRFGRIFRSTNLMVNVLDPRVGPRDPKALSPHHHDDFEQCSLVLDGHYVHHIRWPWISDSTRWRQDDHEECGAPSVTVIPPPAVHTSHAIGEGLNQMVDIFCPPRVDFSQKAGWVLNADDYPLPAR